MKTICEVQQETTVPDMYGTAGMPDLLPPAECELRPGPLGARGGASEIRAPPQRIQRPPKLGQIGRSKRGMCELEANNDSQVDREVRELPL